MNMVSFIDAMAELSCLVIRCRPFSRANKLLPSKLVLVLCLVAEGIVRVNIKLSQMKY
jgi:hypothetical protein